MDPNELLMQLMAHEQSLGGPAAPVDFTDPEAVDWNGLATQYQLSPDEVQQLQIQQPEGGPSLSERLQRLRPQTSIGPLELSTDGRRIRGRMRF